jgi:ketosteroid isomerase-like protein
MRRNVDVVRRFLRAFDNDTERFRKTIHSEIEWFPFELGDNPTYGADGALRIRRRWLDTWEEHRIEIQQLVAQGRNVVASICLRARGRGSGIELETCLHLHYKLEEEKIAYLCEHQDRDSALEAAGIG